MSTKSNSEEVSSQGGSGRHSQDATFKNPRNKDQYDDFHHKPTYRIDQRHHSDQRFDRQQKFYNDNRNRSNQRDRFNPPRNRDRSPPRNNSNNVSNRRFSKPRNNEKRDVKPQPTSIDSTTDPIASKVKDPQNEASTGKEKQTTELSNPVVTSMSSNVPDRTMPAHGHYRHKNSNKPRFAKVFTENAKEKSPVDAKTSDIAEELQSIQSEISKENSNGHDLIQGKEEESTGVEIIDQLKSISLDLNKSSEAQGEDVFAKLKSGEAVELDNLKQLYDKIPDITKTDLINKDGTEEWPACLPTPDANIQECSKELTCDEVRPPFLCCPHGNQCCPPYFHHGFMPPSMPPPHPAYYYAAALWNYHHPVPPPAVQRLATAPHLPASESNGAVHKRFITRSTKTPGSIAFTLHSNDNLRVVSVRCDETFTMTADLCNEEGEKVAENFALHNENSPKLWEQYAFSGNHTLHFNIDAPKPTVVVVTFLHEIPLK